MFLGQRVFCTQSRVDSIFEKLVWIMFPFIFQLKVEEALKQKERYHKEHEEVRYGFCFGALFVSLGIFFLTPYCRVSDIKRYPTRSVTTGTRWDRHTWNRGRKWATTYFYFLFTLKTNPHPTVFNWTSFKSVVFNLGYFTSPQKRRFFSLSGLKRWGFVWCSEVFLFFF